MDYFFNTGLAGSLMWFFYLLIKLAAKGRLSERWRYVMLKCVLAYYLIPIPFMKKFYNYVWEHISLTKNVPEWLYWYKEDRRVLMAAQNIYLDSSLTRKLLTGVIMAGIAAAVFLYKVGRYRRQRKALLRCRGDTAKNALDGESCKALQESVGLQRDIIYIDSSPADGNGNTAFTIGIWKPVVLYPAKRSPQERKLILEHELQHVKNRDVFWRMLLSFGWIFHCCNPFMWFFAGEFEAVSEMVCDAGVVRNKGEQERSEYAKLLLQMAQDEAGDVVWSVGISKKWKMKERIEHIMKKEQKYMKGIVSAMLIGAAVVLNSFTAFAYEDVKVWREETDPEDFFQKDIVFAQEGADLTEVEFMDALVLTTTILYDTQFEDEAGNLYEVYDEGISAMATCAHQYVNGTISEHKQDSEGGCTITYYKAQRCSKCGLVIKNSRISVITYDVCPH